MHDIRLAERLGFRPNLTYMIFKSLLNNALCCFLDRVIDPAKKENIAGFRLGHLLLHYKSRTIVRVQRHDGLFIRSFVANTGLLIRSKLFRMGSFLFFCQIQVAILD